MKKILLCTTALFGLAAGSALAAGDNGTTVTFQGSSKFEAGTVNQDSRHRNSVTPNSKTSGFYTVQKASLKAEGKTDDLTYGAVMRLQVIGNGSDGMGHSRNDRSHIYLDTDAGSVQLGSNFAASKLMQIDASTIASATGGIDGDFATFANTNFDPYTITSVDTLSNRIDSQGESARKITYLSPRISGVELGVSFTPDLNNTGDEKLSGTVSETYLGQTIKAKNVWSLGLNYKNNFDGIDVALAAVMDKGTSTAQTTTLNPSINYLVNGSPAILQNINANQQAYTLRNLRTYSLGGVVGTNGFSFALSYHNDGNSLTSATVANEASNISSSWWTTGVAYENGPMSTSLTYLNGYKKDKNDATSGLKTQIVSLGADYEVAPGLKPFAEVTNVSYKPKTVTTGTNTKATATVFLLGTKVKF